MGKPSEEFERKAVQAGIAEEGVVRTEVQRWDQYWAAQALVLAAILLDVSLARRITVGPAWLLPTLEGVALLALLASSPTPILRHHPLRRHFSLAIIGLV